MTASGRLSAGGQIETSGWEDCNFWVFDMDGTLTVAVHDFEEIRRELGLPVGEPILEALEKLPRDRASVLHDRLDEIELQLAREAQAQDGARELLTFLGDNNSRSGIVTRNGYDIALETLKACGLAEFFETGHIISRECSAPKPSPDGVCKLLALWDAAPNDAVMIGDYLFDLQAGRGAGTATIFLDVHGTGEWRDHADLTVRGLGEIKDMLLRS
ncbi:MAG: HAD family hydrolase [Gammaproteobacteria bacterium]